MVRALLLALSLTGAAVAAASFEGLSHTEAAVRAVEAAAASPEQADIAARAILRLKTSWARPLLWSARANEAMSALYALRFDASADRRWSALSLRHALRAIKLSPASPQSWARIAKLAMLGEPGAPCAPFECLERSWRAAPIADPDTDCARVRLAAEAGLQPDRLRRRLLVYAGSGVSAEAVNTCLDFLQPHERVEYVFLARAG